MAALAVADLVAFHAREDAAGQIGDAEPGASASVRIQCMDLMSYIMIIWETHHASCYTII